MSYVIGLQQGDIIFPPSFPGSWVGAPQNLTGTNVNTAQDWIAASGRSILGTRFYLFGGVLRLTTHTTSHSIGVSFDAGGATIQSVRWEGVGYKAAENGAAAVTVWRGVFNDLANRQLTPADTTAGAVIEVNGVIRVTTNGTLTPKFTMSSVGAAPVIREGTRFWVHERGPADSWTGDE